MRRWRDGGRVCCIEEEGVVGLGGCELFQRDIKIDQNALKTSSESEAFFGMKIFMRSVQLIFPRGQVRHVVQSAPDEDVTSTSDCLQLCQLFRELLSSRLGDSCGIMTGDMLS